MRKSRYCGKRVLALALSAAVMFAQTGVYVSAAEEFVEQSADVDDSGEVADSDSAVDSEAAGDMDSANDSDAQSPSGGGLPEEEPEDMSAGDSDSGEAQQGENVEDDSILSESISENAIDVPQTESSVTAFEDANTFASGKVNNITWEIDESGKLTIEGTGDYISGNAYDTDDSSWHAPWADTSKKRYAIKSAVIKISGITSTKKMFYQCGHLTSIDLTGLDTSEVTDMSRMFATMDDWGGCELTSLDLSGLDTGKVQNMQGMFAGCKNLASLDVSGFDTSKVMDMSEMFIDCSSLTALNLKNFNTSNVTDMNGMFGGCKSLSALDVSSFDTGNVTDMSGMFSVGVNNQGLYGVKLYGSSLTKLDLSNFDTSNVTNMSRMFYYAVKLSDLELGSFDTANVTDMSRMFGGCESLAALDVSSFDTGNVTDMSGMFNVGTYRQNSGGGDVYTSSLTKLDLSNFNTSNVTDMRSMFYCASKLRELKLGSLDTRKVGDMSQMFEGCLSLNRPDVSNFDTGRVISMERMFYHCQNMTALDLSSFDTSNVADISGVFDGCGSLTYLCTPKNLTITAELPSGADVWYREDGTECGILPIALPYSIVLYKNGYPGDGTTKQIVSISGIMIGNKIYDGEPAVYTGTAVVTDFAGNEIPDVALGAFYTGTLANGSPYAKDAAAPTEAGSYNLSFEAAGLDGEKYIIKKTVYSFRIFQKEAVVTAPSEAIEIGGIVPELNGLTCEVSGLPENVTLQTKPSLKYSVDAEKIPVYVAGRYDIIPYGAVIAGSAANNYAIRYVRGRLIVGEPEEELIASGKINKISWKLDKTGKLTVEGTGNYSASSGRAPWTKGKVRDRILSAEVNVSEITSTYGMFYDCKNLRSVDLAGLDTSKVEDMSSMFDFCESLKSLDLSGFDTSKVKGMSRMFYGCKSLKSLDLRDFKTSNVEDMGRMFSGCQNLESLDVNGLDTSKVTSLREMFKDCSSLTDLYISGFGAGKVTDMSGMFSGCRSLKSLDISGFSTGKVTNMSEMFSGCSSLKSLDISGFSTGKVTDMSEMFSGCRSLENLDLSGFDTSRVADMSGMFSGCVGLECLNLSGFGKGSPNGYGNQGSLARSMKGMFQNCIALTALDVSSLYTGNIWNMDGMFENCSSLVDLDVSGFDTSEVTSMSNMFFGCTSLVSLDVSSFDTSKVTDMSSMFSGCRSLTDLNTGGFGKSSLSQYQTRDMENIFNNCEKLTGLDLRNFEMGNSFNASAGAVISDYMFSGCISLSYLFAPLHCRGNVPLPTSSNADQWTSEDGTVYKNLPKDLSESIILHKNAYLAGEGGTMKQIVFVSGISVKNKVFDGTPCAYTGTALLKDSSGNTISGLSLTYTYAGTLMDNTPYVTTTEAPSQAGSYTLSVEAAGTDAGKYMIHNGTYGFSVMQKEMVITAPSRLIDAGGELPVLSALSCRVSGLCGEDQLAQEPMLKYSEANISTAKEGRYQIIPYGALAGNNYSISYVNGTLIIADVGDIQDPVYGDVLPEDIPADKVIPEGLWIAGVDAVGYDYTGKAVKPEVRVYDHTTVLKVKTDYTIAYKNNTKANDASDEKTAPTITVTGRGNYTGKETQTFKILPPDIGSDAFSADDMALAYKSGKEQKPVPILWWNDRKLSNKKDYTIAYLKGTAVLDSVTDTGDYVIVLTGQGNFSGTRRINLTVTDSLKLMDKTSVAKIPNQSYTGSAVKPVLTVKDEKAILNESEHYTVEYRCNVEVGTAYAVITGEKSAGYIGTKRVSFKITGTPIKKAAVTGLTDRAFVYDGVDIEPKLTLSVKIGDERKTLIEGTDYRAEWQKNRNAGTAAVVFTGMGNYTGTMKKTFKIQPFDIATNAGGCFEVIVDDYTVPYAKGGAKPVMHVIFQKDGGTIQRLVEGKDYTISYKNNTAVNDWSNQKKIPTATIKGKGNFKGVFATKPEYQITAQDIGKLAMMAADKTYQDKKKVYVTKLTVTDLDGKVLKAGTDYDKVFTYTYKNAVTLDNGTLRAAGTVVDQEDIIPAGTVLVAAVCGKGNYTGTLAGEYRIAQAGISGASVTIPKQTYTGKTVALDKSMITVRIKGDPVDPSQYEIIPDSYKNNVKKGTASVTIRGVDNYGGTKVVKFTIGAKGFLWWWRKQG